MTKMTEVLGDALCALLPDDMAGAVEVLTGIDYPIADYGSFRKSLQERSKTTEPQVRAQAVIERAFTPDLFPIMTAQGAVEKLLHSLDISRVPRIRPEDLFPRDQFRERLPDPGLALYVSLFGEACGAEAYVEYLDVVRGASPIIADRAARTVGERCVWRRQILSGLLRPGVADVDGLRVFDLPRARF